jgi:hypothetical protein
MQLQPLISQSRATVAAHIPCNDGWIKQHGNKPVYADRGILISKYSWRCKDYKNPLGAIGINV